jgi:pilus assembly protein CpaF
MRALVRNSLRMRPDRIVLGEVRGSEVIDMLQAMNTGHEGSLTTIHANTARDALSRLENLVNMGGVQIPIKTLRQQISSAIHIVIQTARLTDGSRKITSIQEITGMEGDMISMQEIFTYERTGTGNAGTVLGHFRATGLRPLVADRIKTWGIALSDDLFEPGVIE